MTLLGELYYFIAVSAPYLIFGFLISGVLHGFLSPDWVAKQFGGSKVFNVIKASLYGIPLPLCSCSVIPTVATFKKKGAHNGSASSFLISTPETGVDSIFLSYGLLGLPMAILRPVSAFITSIVAGCAQLFFPDFKYQEIEKAKGCCGCSINKKSKIREIYEFAFDDLVDDISLYLLIGFIIGALINVYVPVNFFEGVNSFWGRILLIVVGIPVYICASSSTPVALSFMIKGASPGTALILMLAGPATNISNLIVLQKYLGKRAIIINVIVVFIVSLILSYITDFLFRTFGWKINLLSSEVTHEHLGVFSHISAVILIVLMIKGIWRENIKNKLVKK